MNLSNLMIYASVCTVAAVTGAGGLHFANRSAQAPDAGMTTGSVVVADAVHEAVAPDRLENGLDALSGGDTAAALALLDTLPPASLDAKALSWAIAMHGGASVPPEHIRAVLTQMTDWPGRTALERNLERAMSRGVFSGAQLQAALGADAPQTFQGAFALAQWKLGSGDGDGARALLAPWWQKQVLTAGDEALVIGTFADVLTPRDHEMRFFNMMVRERVTSAARVAPLIKAEKLHDTWSAVIRRQKDASAKIKALGTDFADTPSRVFMEAEHARRSGDLTTASDLLIALKIDSEWQINPDAWWVEQRIVARDLYELGDAERAYAIAAAHSGGQSQTQAEATFHAGWFALRGLNDPDKALPHFKQIEAVSKGASSLGRAHYWQARALMKADPAAGKAALEKAAHYATSFYGQLAAAELSRGPLAITDPQPAIADQARLMGLAPYRALERFVQAGHANYAEPLYYGLADMARSPGEIAMLTNHAQSRGLHNFALRIAKRADWNGMDVGGLTHPQGAIPESTILSAKNRALAHAIARQESEFNVSAVSKANARGLLQLLPGTAKSMAEKVGLAYAPEKLTSDAAYNAALGTTYLDELLARYDGSYILTFAAYNAGPGRVKEWINRFGDPRGKPLEEVVDWVEKIPFPETRSYVQRIIENLQVYKARFDIDGDITRDLRFGRTS